MLITQLNTYNQTSYPEHPTLFLEFHGNKSGNHEDIQLIQQLFEEFKCTQFIFEEETGARLALWKARHDLSYAFKHLNPHYKVTGSNVCVPISYLSQVVEYARTQITNYNLDGAIVGHVGEGNFHTIIVYDPSDQEQVRAVEKVNDLIVHMALEFGEELHRRTWGRNRKTKISTLRAQRRFRCNVQYKTNVRSA
jgi:D-lactate dehydrogenase (cytochrome)